ncbi:unnamed protein product, partial [Musa hybrid cultivar]
CRPDSCSKKLRDLGFQIWGSEEEEAAAEEQGSRRGLLLFSAALGFSRFGCHPLPFSGRKKGIL